MTKAETQYFFLQHCWERGRPDHGNLQEKIKSDFRQVYDIDQWGPDQCIGRSRRMLSHSFLLAYCTVRTRNKNKQVRITQNILFGLQNIQVVAFTYDNTFHFFCAQKCTRNLHNLTFISDFHVVRMFSNVSKFLCENSTGIFLILNIFREKIHWNEPW